MHPITLAWTHKSPLPKIPNGISLGSAVFAWLTIVADRPTERRTDRATQSVVIGRIYVRSIAMRPKN